MVGSAAAELDDAGLPGSQLTPEELADMVAMAATATPPPVVPRPED
jgi:hypothetical protein